MEELLQNDSVIANVVWELVIRGAFVCYAFLYAAITRNLSKSSAMEDKLDPFAIVLFFIGAFPVWVIVGIYKGIKYLIKRRNEKRCFSHHTEGTFVHTLKFLFREDDHLMVNKYETIVEYYWDKQNGFCKKVTSVGYEKVFMTSKNGWEEVYRDESVDTNDNTRSSTKLSIKTIRFLRYEPSRKRGSMHPKHIQWEILVREAIWEICLPFCREWHRSSRQFPSGVSPSERSATKY